MIGGRKGRTTVFDRVGERLSSRSVIDILLVVWEEE